MYLAQILQ